MRTKILSAALVATLFSACDDPGDAQNENELITTVGLTFTPIGGGTPSTFLFDDPDGDGGDAPVVDTIALAAGDYELAVFFENRLETPPEDITEEISDEAADHQIFFTGSGIDGPATDNAGAPLLHSYDDADANGLAIGLGNLVTATTGTGEVVVTLRHLPPLGDVAVKTSELAATIRTGGFSAIGGATDAQVTLPVSVP